MPVKHGPKGMPGRLADAGFGTPYSVGEARAFLDQYGDRLDIYPRELMLWLCDRVEELEDSVRPPGVPLTRGGEKRRR